MRLAKTIQMLCHPFCVLLACSAVSISTAFTTILYSEEVLSRFDRLSVEDGLSHNQVLCIHQDRRGFVWFGTFVGLNRYDGYTFKIYRNNPSDDNSLSQNTVEAIYEDVDGFFWIGTRGGGLERFDPATETFVHFRHDPQDSNSLGNDFVKTVCESTDGTLWIGTKGGMSRMDPETKKFNNFAPRASDPYTLSHSYVKKILAGENGTLWIATGGGGLCRLSADNRDSGKLQRFMHCPEDPFSLNSDFVSSLCLDRSGILWVGTYGGVGRYDPDGACFRRLQKTPGHKGSLAGNTVNVVYEDRAGSLWIGTKGQGLDRLEIATGTVRHYHPFDDVSGGAGSYPILSIFQDQSGILWFGTDGYGVLKLSPRHKAFMSFSQVPGDSQSLAINSIRALHEDFDGAVWVGGYFGLDRIDLRTSRCVHFGKPPLNPCVYSLLEDPLDAKRILWVGSEGSGLFKFDRLQGMLIPYGDSRGLTDTLEGNYVLSLHADESGLFWIGTEQGLNRYDPATGKCCSFGHDDQTPHSLIRRPVQTIYEDRKGCLWFGTDQQGLYRLTNEDRRAGRFTQLRHDPDDPNTLGSDNVLCMTEDHDGNVWVGLFDGGLNRLVMSTLNRTLQDGPMIENVVRYTMAEGLPENTVLGIIEDDAGFLWLSTTKGLSRFNPESETFRNYDVTDGLPGNVFNAGAHHKGRSGLLYFGGNKGFVAFHPDSLRDNPHIPPVVITSFQKFNEEARLDTVISEIGELRLSHKDYVISFEFAALDFMAPAKNRYSYILEGFDKEWNNTDARKRFATYTNLHPGKYVFRVKGSNNDGLWNEEGTSLAVIVAPPFWGTLWFRALVSVVFAATLGSLYWSRVRVLKSRQIAHEQFSRQLIESQEEERKRIAAELHDSLGQDLLVIKNRAVLGSQACQDNQKAQDQLREISSVVDQALRDTQQISLNLRPYQLDRLGLTQAIKSMVHSIEDASEIFFETEIENIDSLVPKEKEINIFRIVQEGLNNVLKHSGAERARLVITRQKQAVQIRIEDSGRGFNADTVRGSAPSAHGFGLSSIKERTEILHGTFRLQSSPSLGTRLTIVIPI